MKKKESNSVVKFPEKLGFATFSGSANIVFGFISTFYTYFLNIVLGIPIALVGTMNTIGAIWDVVNDPLIGVWANNIKFKNGEKMRPFLKYLAVPFALGMVLQFANFHLPVKATVITSLVIFFFYEIANTFRGIVYNGMAGLASPSDDDRKSINTYRSIGGGLGTAIGSVAVTPLVKAFGGLSDGRKIINEQDSTPIFLTACVLGVLIVIGCMIHYFTTKERVKAIEENEEKISILDTYKMLFGCTAWVKNVAYILCYAVICKVVMFAITYYASFVLGDTSKALTIQIFYIVSSLGFAFVTPAIDTKLGRKKTMILGALIQIIAEIPFILNPGNFALCCVNATGLGIAITIAFVCFNTNRNNITDIIELKDGRRLDTMVATGDGLVTKISEALALQITTMALDKAGFDSALMAAQPIAAQNAINAFLGIVPAIFAALMIVAASTMTIEKELKELREKKGININQ